ncbi:MAG: polysaccharide deacetylase family protein [Anaerolineae bacterium]
MRTAEGQPILYLTFDDGPSPVYTAQIVDLLQRYDAQATFFVVGLHARRAPAALRPVAEAGHAIANHTFSHRSLARPQPGSLRRRGAGHRGPGARGRGRPAAGRLSLRLSAAARRRRGRQH